MRLVHWVTARASLFTDHKISGLPMRAKYRLLFENNLGANFWRFSNRSPVLLKLMVVNAQGCDFSLHDLPYHRTMKRCSRQVYLYLVAFLKIQQRFWIETYFYNCPQYLCLVWHSRWIQPKSTWSKNDVGSPKSTCFHIGSRSCFPFFSVNE